VNDFDEEIVKACQSANMEFIELIKKYQKESIKCGRLQFLAITILSVTVILVSVFAYLNNQKWIEVFNSYEYETIAYTQDGNGINNYNSGIMGDLDNGANNSYTETDKEETTSNNNTCKKESE
jgi:hypothetical protein